MTEEQKLKACRMRLEGATLREIADKFGVSRQYIHTIVPYQNKSGRQRKSPRGCIYRGVAIWMSQNRHSYGTFARMCGVSEWSMRCYLTGETNIRKGTIDKILEITGMSYEQAFYTGGGKYMPKYPVCEKCCGEINPHKYDGCEKAYTTDEGIICRDCFLRGAEEFIRLNTDQYAAMIGASVTEVI